MKKTCRQLHNTARQRGTLMVATLLILLVISLLGMASVDSTGLEMKMSSNSRVQQQVFEAAEYTLSWVENNMQAAGYFTNGQLSNGATGGSCGAVCFTSTCSNGYCFSGGAGPTAYATCTLNAYTTEPSADATLWAAGSGRYKTLAIPGTALVTKYIIEYRCFTAKIPGTTTASNPAQMYRITTLATGEDGRARVMLRSTVRKPN